MLFSSIFENPARRKQKNALRPEASGRRATGARITGKITTNSSSARPPDAASETAPASFGPALPIDSEIRRAASEKTPSAPEAPGRRATGSRITGKITTNSSSARPLCAAPETAPASHGPALPIDSEIRRAASEKIPSAPEAPGRRATGSRITTNSSSARPPCAASETAPASHGPALPIDSEIRHAASEKTPSAPEAPGRRATGAQSLRA